MDLPFFRQLVLILCIYAKTFNGTPDAVPAKNGTKMRRSASLADSQTGKQPDDTGVLFNEWNLMLLTVKVRANGSVDFKIARITSQRT